MKFRCTRSSLENALDMVSHVIDANVTLPVLNNILIKCKNKRAYFSATNLEMAVNFEMEAEVINEGLVTVPAKLFCGYITLLKDPEVECSVVEGLTLSIHSAGSKTKIKCIAGEEFPTISKIDEIASLSVSCDGLPEAIEQVCFASSPHHIRPALSGVYFDADGKTLIMVATDSFRLSEKKLQLQKAVDKPMHGIVPTRAVLEMARLASKFPEEKEASFVFGKNQVMFKIGSMEFYTRLIEGNFPNYRQILPRSIRTSTSISTADQSLAVKRVELFAKENNNKVLFDFQKDKLKITTPATQVGEEEGELPIALSGDPGMIALNGDFVLDVLSHIGVDQVEIGMNDSKSPAVFKPVGKDDFVHIIMPLKL